MSTAALIYENEMTVFTAQKKKKFFIKDFLQ